MIIAVKKSPGNEVVKARVNCVNFWEEFQWWQPEQFSKVT